MTSWTEWATLIAMIIVNAGLVSWVFQQLKTLFPSWGRTVKNALAVALSLAVAFAEVWLAGTLLGLVEHWGTLSAVDIYAAGLTIATGAQLIYQKFWKPRELSGQ